MIPKKVRIGQHTYSVKRLRSMPYYGDIAHCVKEIRLAKRIDGLPLPLTNQEQYVTFWHEVVHGILDSMGRHRLNKDERFVDVFAHHIAQVVRPRMFPRKKAPK